MSPPYDRYRPFIRYLEELLQRESRAALAMLRRGLGKPPATVFEMHRYVVPWLPDKAAWREEKAYYVVATLFALHPRSWTLEKEQHQGTSFGASMARLGSMSDSESIEKRFVALLNCHHENLPVHLRHAVALLKTKEIPVNWAQLLYDVSYWDHDDRFVQRKWSHDFWRPVVAEGPKSVEESSSDVQ